MEVFPKYFDGADKIQLIISYLIRLALVVAIGEAIFVQEWVTVFVSFLILLLTFIPAFMYRNFKIHLPIELELTTVVFVYAAIFLGMVRDYYVQVWWWDILAHAMLGIVMGFAGFLILFMLYHRNKVKASPFMIAIFSFCFAVAIGALWEIVEFFMDEAFGLNMQKSGLVDTMWDIIVDVGGALLASVIGYFYIKGGSPRLVNRIVQKFLLQNPRFK